MTLENMMGRVAAKSLGSEHTLASLSTSIDRAQDINILYQNQTVAQNPIYPTHHDLNE